jgi:hypothetical protein
MKSSPLVALAFVLAFVFVFTAAASADDPPAKRSPAAVKDDADAQKVDVLFVNGSKVIMAVLEDKIEIATDYGKLSIPPRDIRFIEFGVHLSKDVEQKIEQALKRLGSDKYKERDQAMKELVSMGPQAYLALTKAAKGDNLEVNTRAKEALKAIAQRVPRKLLRLKEEDKIRTSKFTVVGRITTSTIKARAEFFGELPLKPGQLVSMSWLSGAGENVVTIDAARHGSGPNQWLDSGITVEAGWGLRLKASGQVDLWPQQPGQYLCGPDGLAGAGGVIIGGRVGRPMLAGQNNGGALMGRIGDNGTPFHIGERKHLTSDQAGKLYLHIVPSPWNNASAGSYRVRIAAGSLVDDEDE